MTVTVDALPDGHGHCERLQVDGATQYVGFSVRCPSGGDGVWVMLYGNAARHGMVRLEGRLDGTRATWRSVMPARTRESEFISEQRGPARWQRTQRVSDDGGQSWRVLFIDDLVRVETP